MIERAEEAAIECAMNSEMYYNIPITGGANVSLETPAKKLTLEDIGLIEDFVAILRKKVQLDQKLLPAHIHGEKDSDSMVDEVKDLGIGRIEVQNFCRRHYFLLEGAIEGNNPKPWLSDSFKKFCNQAKNEGLYAKQVVYQDIMSTCKRIYEKLKETES